LENAFSHANSQYTPTSTHEEFEQSVKCLHTVLDIVIDNALNLERSTRKPYARH